MATIFREMQELWVCEMKENVKTAAYNLLDSLTALEVEELIEVLKYYNSSCQEDSRAECLRVGCSKKDGSQPSEGERRLMEKTAGSTNIYMSGSSSVCPCCKR